MFPVDPKIPLNEKPYMQRAGGAWDGRDLRGANLKGQAAPQRYTEVDKKYEAETVTAAASKKAAALPEKKAPIQDTPPKKKGGLFGLF